ncbi:MAG: hypothetical protein ABI175_26895 [Polyangiales bacterium]
MTAAKLLTSDPDAPIRQPASVPQVAAIVAGTIVILNVAFYFLSGAYFDDRAAIYGGVTPEHISGVRVAFGIFSGSVGAAGILAVWQPKVVAHVIAAVAGIAAFAAGVGAAYKGMTPVLPAALIVSGLMFGLLVMQSLRRIRLSWAFLMGMTAVFSAVLLFGSTKVRGALDVGLWTALIIPGLLAVATVGLAMTRDEYRDA